MKHKLSLSLLILFLLFSLIILIQYRHEDDTCLNRLMIIWDEDTQASRTYLYESSGIYYGFLPAYADLGLLSIHTDTGYSVWLNDTLWEDTLLQTNREYTLTVKNPWGRSVSEAPFILMQSENIPALSIQLYNGSMVDIDQHKEEPGHMTLIGANQDTIYEGDFEKFHIRGNHTATLSKKLYALKFSREVDLLGSGSFTTYCLVANADDESRLRNKLVYETAQELGLAHSPESSFVDLYIDNAYYGLYMLTDKIDVHENRIGISPLQERTQSLNFFSLKQYDAWSSDESGTLRKGLQIPINPADITGGYLLEYEVGYRMEDSPNTFVSDSGQNVSIKYPAQCSAEQVNYIADYYQRVEDSVADGTFTQYIDLESFAKFYLIEEFFAQIDRTSIFFYKDSDLADPKLYAGPVWDFDWSMGLSETYTDRLHISPYQFYFRWSIFGRLWEQEVFRSAVQEIYETQFHSIISEFLPEAFDYYEAQISASHAMDKCRWDHIFTAPHGPYAGSLKGSLDIMKRWISQRTDCFREIFLEKHDMIQLTLFTDESSEPFASYSLPPNSYFYPDNEIPVRDGYVFSGWYSRNGDLLTESTKLTEDTVFYAKWENRIAPDEPAADTAEERSSLSRLFKYTDLTDYCILLALGGICLFVVFQVFRDQLSHIRNKAKKRSSQNEGTKITP